MACRASGACRALGVAITTSSTAGSASRASGEVTIRAPGQAASASLGRVVQIDASASSLRDVISGAWKVRPA